MISDQNKAAVKQLVEGLGTNGSPNAFDVLHDDAVWTVMADADTFPVSGDMPKPAFIEHMRRFRDSLPSGIHVSVTSVIADEANASVEATSNALLANGQTLNQVYHFAFEIEGGKVVRAREYIDTARALSAFSSKHPAGSSTTTKIRFRLDRDEDGWPPAESEGVWAEPLGNDRYQIVNTPWFIRGTSAEDVVRALADDDGVLWFSETLVHGGHQTIRIIPRDDGRLNGDRQAVLDAFAPLNISGEGLSDQFRIVALDIGPDTDVAAVKQLCIDGEADGRWYHEEGNVTPEWIAS